MALVYTQDTKYIAIGLGCNRDYRYVGARDYRSAKQTRETIGRLRRP